MRFQQLMKQSNAILKKKMYKSGKNWIVKSTLSIAGGLALFGVSQNTVVKADELNNQVPNVQGQEQIKIDQGTASQSTASQSTAQGESSKQDTSSDKESAIMGVKGDVQTPPQPSVENNTDGDDAQNENDTHEEGYTGIQDLQQKTNPQDMQSDGPATPQNTQPDQSLSGLLGTSEDPATWSVENGTDLIISGKNMDSLTNNISPWGSEEVTEYLKNNITQVFFIPTEERIYAGESISGLFNGFKKLVSVDHSFLLDTSKVKDFSYLFNGCENLVATDRPLNDLGNPPQFAPSFIFGNYNDINCKNMFSDDKSLKSISLSVDEYNDHYAILTDARSMFYGDSSLTSVDITNIGMTPESKTQDLFRWANNIKELGIDSNFKLTDSGLSVLHNQKDLSKGITSWSLRLLSHNIVEKGLIKDTDELVNTYTGNKNSKGGIDSAFWVNYDPFVFTVIGMDTNGKELESTSAYIPIDYPYDMTKFEETLKKLKENGAIVPNDSASNTGSRESMYYVKENVTSGPGIVNEGMDDAFIPFTSKLLSTYDLYDLINKQIPIESSAIRYSFFSDRRNVVYLVYQAKETPNSEKNNSTSGGSSTINREIEGIEEKIATYAERPAVQLYDDNGSILTDRKLAPNSDWYTDESMQLDKEKYYRVATNQWAKANDVYFYYPNESKVRVNAGSIATLVTDEGKTVTDRALQPLSNWYTDKYIYINDVKYYRVATNEFVSANDVQEY